MRRLEHWIAAWADMICGLIAVLTFSFYRPWWDFRIRGYFTKRDLKKRIAKQGG